jgi:hypothetical protein
MSHELPMADLAVRLTERHVLSAAPDAPVVEHRGRRRPWGPRRRRARGQRARS